MLHLKGLFVTRSRNRHLAALLPNYPWILTIRRSMLSAFSVVAC